jgi:hypothetical protein
MATSTSSLAVSAGALALGLALAAPSRVGAEPLRLRSNAYADTHEAAPVGLLLLSASGENDWLSAEAVVWLGSGDETEADAMTASVKLLDRDARRELQLGRFLVTPGAVRPVHVDGARARAALPWNTNLELFGGVPVVPELGANSYDWVVGGRAGRQIGDYGGVGVAYLQRRSEGRLTEEEAGVDLYLTPAPWLDLSARAAYDLQDPGVSDARASASVRRGRWRHELFASHRSPSRILPATSLFTVLGDIASQRFGGGTKWRASPRLDLEALGAARRLDGKLSADLRFKATLRLDDRGQRACSLELRRDSLEDARWSGARAALRLPLDGRFTLASELELAVPDEDDGRGSVWPWALASLGWQFAPAWQAAAAIEASSSPAYDYRVDALVRITRLWELP